MVFRILILSTDTSPYSTTAYLSQFFPDNIQKPVGFLPRTLINAEKRYKPVVEEELANIFALNLKKVYFYGNRYTLFTDSKRLVLIFYPTKSILVISVSIM